MTENGENKARIRPLVVAACVAFALEFAGCKGGTDGAASSEPGAGAAGTATNSAMTNASVTVDTNSAMTNASATVDTNSAATNASTTADTNTTTATTNP